ncbi:MAG: glycosyltransferase [Oscillospiraceae bacterium]|nr:glycosyltransferase [Oscillospiraceae bacterium]
MKKKILITLHSMEVGGIERSAANLLSAFDYDTYDVDVLLFSKKGEFLPLLDPRCNLLPEMPQCAAMLKPVREVLLSGHPVMALKRVYAKLKKKSGVTPDEAGYALLQAYWDVSVSSMPKLRQKYDAAISFMWPHHFVARNIRADKKFAWIHTDYARVAVNRKKDEAVWRQFDRIAAVSDDCGKTFLKVHPSLGDRLVTVENVLSAELVRAQADEFIPQEMKVDGTVRLLTVGRFCYAKAFDSAVDICRLLADRGTDITWYAIGYGDGQQSLLEQVRRLGLEERFIILGKKVNPYPYMKNCDIYVQPSRYEGKAVTIREAQILGRPVIITDFATAKSQVRGGVDAMIVPMDSESVADGIETLIKDADLRERLAQNARGIGADSFTELDKIYRLIEGDF